MMDEAKINIPNKRVEVCSINFTLDGCDLICVTGTEIADLLAHWG
jgi:hypothetical protein